MNKSLLKFSLVALLSLGLASCGETQTTVEPTSEPEPTTVEPTSDPEPTSSQVEGYEYQEDETAGLPEDVVTKIRVHYKRNDETSTFSNYNKWSIWAWDSANGAGGSRYQFTKYDHYGVWGEFLISDVTGGKASTQLGFIISTETWTKDVEDDRYIDIDASAPGGVQHIYLRQNIAKVFPNEYSALHNALSYARYIDKNTIRVVFNILESSFEPRNENFKIYINGELDTGFTMTEFSAKNEYAVLHSQNDIDISDVVNIHYVFDGERDDKCDMIITNYFDSDEFNELYAYDGDDLGATFDNEKNPTSTSFKLWAPTCRDVKLTVTENGDPENEGEVYLDHVQMVKGEKGVWSFVAERDLSNCYYYYTVSNSRGTNDVVDPYAKSAGINGKRGMVVNFTKINEEIEDWEYDYRPFYGVSGADASIYEIHVRDMTINPNSGVSKAHRGKFLGLAEKGTYFEKDNKKVTTGLDHILDLGVTHVQIQPFYDYSSVDETLDGSEMSETNYNWGYDPLNYNVLEGSYSTNPYDGKNRIIEFKQMVMAMHEYGININMDVVYNHTSSLNTSNFEMVVPYYYHRFRNSGRAYNGSGCGNEMASDRYMVNKFVRESCKMFIDEYHLSGFRFDLMGLMDNQVMIDVYNDCKEIYEDIMVYGEPWTGGTSKLVQGNNIDKLKEQQTIQSSLGQSYFAGDGVLVGAFSDGFRNGVKGSQDKESAFSGYVQGDISTTSSLKAGVQGLFTEAVKTVEPGQVINYVSCHDNFTLYDHLIKTVNELSKNDSPKGDRVFEDVYKQAEAMVFMSQGVAFMQEGEDFMRSKAYLNEEGETVYSHNSYNVGDFINNMDYELKLDNIEMFEYFQALVVFRKLYNAFTLSTRDYISSAITKVNASNKTGDIAFNINYNDETYMVIHSVNGGEFNVGEVSVLIASNEKYELVDGKLTLEPNTSIVLNK